MINYLQKNFLKIFNTIPKPIVIISNEGKVKSINSAFFRLFRLKEVDFIDKNYLILMDILSLEYDKTIIEKALDGKYITNAMSGINDKKYIINAYPFNEAGEVIGVIITYHIITNISLPTNIDNVMGNKDVFDNYHEEKLKADLLKFDRLSLVGEMAAGLVHEIRNPMTTIRGFLQILYSKEECEKHKEYFELMINELDRAGNIITEFLSLAKINQFQPAVKNISAIVEAIQPLLESDALLKEMNIIFELNEVPDLLLDENKIRQLIINLVKNALESMAIGGTVKVTTFAVDTEVVLSIKDEGKGIDSETLRKLGTPFVTNKEQGTGLGLATCYNIVEQHNALIEVETGPLGTTFHVRFSWSEPEKAHLCKIIWNG